MKKILLAGGFALVGTQAAYAVDMPAGEWTVSVGGIVNAYYTAVNCSDGVVGGTALAGRALGCGGQSSRTTIGNGLLPDGLITSVKSKQGEYDVAGTIGIMAHTATDSAIAANSGVDVRQAFFSFGNANLGTLKLGRDYGIFGSGAILGDMTLLGAGAPVQATQRGRVTLGHIGAGYSYLGTYGQIAYSSPTSTGFKVDAALVSPVSADAAGAGAGSTPQVQAQLSYGQNGLKTWFGTKTQKFNTSALAGEYRMSGFEIGGSYTAGALGLLANVQTGKGLGILSEGDQGDIRTTGYLLQATYKTSDKLKLGASYGMSRNKEDTTGLRSNSNITLGSYYALTKSVTLVGELGQTRSKAVNGTSARMNGVSLGGILFF
ncbi:MAG TPA: porin [Noviherbaspirillum sp.]|uniref:porin n=1 Tax=Noviherbaspirillum sp. TaxID=1926288 RepID=UPI002B485DB9|nr:porin [Noviherbaspirillum sp.]HJV86417.1 porin [Noviherbaspirillum sp.]